MVRAKIRINKRLARLKIIKAQKKSKSNILRLKERKTDFQLELKNRFESLDIDTKFDLISTTVAEAAEEIAPKERKIKKTSEEDERIKELDKKGKGLREIEKQNYPAKGRVHRTSQNSGEKETREK